MEVDLDKFATAIEGVLTGNAVGYSFYIMKRLNRIHPVKYEVRSYGTGYARLPLDLPPGVDQVPTKQMEVGSISKTITAAAVVKVLDDIASNANHVMHDKLILVDPQKDKSPLGASISPFFPINWAQGSGIEQITFRQLLTHTSGLIQEPKVVGDITLQPGFKAGGPSSGIENTFDELKLTIADGTFDFNGHPAPPPGPYHYQNANFSLFRVMLPYMVYGSKWMDRLLEPPPHRPSKKSLTSDGFKFTVGSYYVGIVQALIFSPIGIYADIDYVSQVPTRYYSVDTPFFSFDDDPDEILLAGSGGWKMCPKDYCEFVAAMARGAFFRKGGLGWEDMKQGQLGLDSSSGIFGEYLGKSGDGGTGDPATSDIFPGFHTAWKWFPAASANEGEVVATLMINSHKAGNGLCNNPQLLLAACHDISLF